MEAFCHRKFQGMPSLMLFTLSNDPHLYGLEMLLSNILMTGLFCSNIRMVIFSKTANSYHMKHVRLPFLV